MSVPTFVVVGGMLGAGRASLIVAAARAHRAGTPRRRRHQRPGQRLVDTALVRTAHVPVAEVSGGCFCCRLSDCSACDALAAGGPRSSSPSRSAVAWIWRRRSSGRCS